MCINFCNTFECMCNLSPTIVTHLLVCIIFLCFFTFPTNVHPSLLSSIMCSFVYDHHVMSSFIGYKETTFYIFFAKNNVSIDCYHYMVVISYGVVLNLCVIVLIILWFPLLHILFFSGITPEY